MTADGEVSELVVRDPRVDKTTFTGSTAASAHCAASESPGARARARRQDGGRDPRPAAIEASAEAPSFYERINTGQVCSSLTRIIVVEPTVFGDVDNSSTIAQEAIFGPVLSVIRAKDEADAVPLGTRPSTG